MNRFFAFERSSTGNQRQTLAWSLYNRAISGNLGLSLFLTQWPKKYRAATVKMMQTAGNQTLALPARPSPTMIPQEGSPHPIPTSR